LEGDAEGEIEGNFEGLSVEYFSARRTEEFLGTGPLISMNRPDDKVRVTSSRTQRRIGRG
jgi:hypothetical protein